MSYVENSEGEIVVCRAKEENRGTGKCAAAGHREHFGNKIEALARQEENLKEKHGLLPKASSKMSYENLRSRIGESFTFSDEAQEMAREELLKDEEWYHEELNYGRHEPVELLFTAGLCGNLAQELRKHFPSTRIVEFDEEAADGYLFGSHYFLKLDEDLYLDVLGVQNHESLAKDWADDPEYMVIIDSEAYEDEDDEDISSTVERVRPLPQKLIEKVAEEILGQLEVA